MTSNSRPTCRARTAPSSPSLRHTVGADYGYLYALTGGDLPGDRRGLACRWRSSARGDGAKRAGVDRAPGSRSSIPDTDVVRHRDDDTDVARPDGHPARPGRPPRHGSSKPDLHGADDHRRSRRPRSTSGTTPGRTSGSGRRGRPPDMADDRRRLRPPYLRLIVATVVALVPAVLSHGGDAGPDQPRLLRVLRTGPAISPDSGSSSSATCGS